MSPRSHRGLAQLALALTLTLAPTLAGAAGTAGTAGTAEDALATADAALARCSTSEVSLSPDEVLAAAAVAERAYAESLAVEPLRAHLGLASTLMECRIEAAPMNEKIELMGRIEGHLQAALEIDPDSRDGHFLYGVLLYHVPPFLGRSDDAIEHFERLLGLAGPEPSPAPPEVYAFLGDLHLRQGRPEVAMEVWRRGRSAHPGAEVLVERLSRHATAPPEAVVPAPPADEEVVPPQPAVPADDGLSGLVSERVDAAVPGIAVAAACGERVLLLAGFGSADVENDVPMSPDSVVRIGSVSKQFTAVVVLRLAEQGVLALDRPIGRWLPAADPSVAEGITIHHLLTHTAGLPRDPVGGADWLRDSLAAPRIGRPGERYAYSNLGYALLGRLIEAATGEPLAELIARLATEPAGLGATAPCDERAIVPRRAGGYSWQGDRLINAEPLDDSSASLAAGGLCSTARDLLDWQRALHGGQLLAAASQALLTTPPTVADADGTTYAAGLRVHAPHGRRVIHHSGATSGFLAEVAHYPEEGLTLVVLANSDAADPRRLGYDLAAHTLAPGRGC